MDFLLGNISDAYPLLQAHPGRFKWASVFLQAVSKFRVFCERHHFTDKGPNSQSYGFSSSHIWMWELDLKEGWVLNNRCFQTVVLEKTLQSPLDWKKMKPVNLKEINPEYSLEELMLKLKLTVLWAPDAKSWIIGKDPDARKEWEQGKKWATE